MVAGLVPHGSYWGKLRRRDSVDPASVEEWHPLIDHCADVAACAVTILGLTQHGAFMPTLLNRRLARLARVELLDVVTVMRLGVLAALHDLGKFNHGFQAKATADRSRWRGHVAEVVPLISGNDDPPTLQRPFLLALDWQAIASWFADPDSATGFLLAVVSHHGQPAADPPGGFEETLWLPRPERDPLRGVAELVAATRTWLPPAWKSVPATIPGQPAFVHAFAGLVQLADWLGSDTSFFPYSAGGERWDTALAAAERAVGGIGLHAAAIRAGVAHAPVFADLFGVERQPRPTQAAIAELPLPDASGSVTLIEDETGAGKTEAALLHFARLFHAGLVDGLYFALPTRTAAIQLHRRVCAAISRLCPAARVVLAVPGYLRVGDEDGQRLPGFEVLWPDRQRDPARWAAEHPKRYLAGTFAVGTIDQVLLSALAVGHSHLRATCLLRHLLVVDEVHASDTYMAALLAEVLKRHRSAGGHALLLSATLGSTAATALLARSDRPALATASAAPYPLISTAGSSPSVTVQTTARKPPVTMQLASGIIDDPAWIADTALAAARSGARVLVLRNTVSGCLAVQAELERRDDGSNLWRVETPHGALASVHHARFAREDRERLDHAIEAAFGGDAQRDRGMVCCATQTVQQSLDLDADLLLTDLCPMDVLLQRIGRLHRHQRSDRAAGFTTPRCILLLPDQDPSELLGANGRPRVRHGLGTVYGDLAVIAATWSTLGDHPIIHIPQDNRTLVEATTHPEALEPWRILDERWSRHANQQLGVGVQHRQQARSNCSRWDLPFDDPQARFPSGDLDRRITSRLGEGDRRIELPPDTVGPFGYAIRSLTIPAWLLHGVPAADEPDIERGQHRLLLVYSDRTFRYDRLGLRLLRDDPEDDYADA